MYRTLSAIEHFRAYIFDESGSDGISAMASFIGNFTSISTQIFIDGSGDEFRRTRNEATFSP